MFDAYYLPLIDDLIDCLGQSDRSDKGLLSSSTLFQFSEKTVFTTQEGLFHYRVFHFP